LACNVIKGICIQAITEYRELAPAVHVLGDPSEEGVNLDPAIVQRISCLVDIFRQVLKLSHKLVLKQLLLPAYQSMLGSLASGVNDSIDEVLSLLLQQIQAASSPHQLSQKMTAREIQLETCLVDVVTSIENVVHELAQLVELLLLPIFLCFQSSKESVCSALPD